MSCPSCGPDVDVIRRTELICAGCGEVLETRREVLKPQDAGTGTEDAVEQPVAAAGDAVEDVIEASPIVSPQDAATGDEDLDVVTHGYRAEPEHDPAAAERDRQRRRDARRRDAARLLDAMRLRGAAPRLIAGHLAYTEDAMSERVQGEIAEVRTEIEELLHAEDLTAAIRAEDAATGQRSRRLVFGQTDRQLDRWTDPAVSRAG